MDSQGRLHGLSWLVSEVASSLDEAGRALEAYVADSSNEQALARCVDLIHQVHGSLKITECHGPLLLAEEMERLAERITATLVISVMDACEVLIQAIITLPNYLRQLLNSRRDQPETLLWLLNELRSVLGEPLVSETAYFMPKMAAAQQLSKPYNRQPDPVTMTNLLRKLRQMYQYAMLGVVKGEKVEENFGFLDKVFSRLRELSKGMPREQLWNVVLAMLEGISEKKIVLGQAVRKLLRELEVEIRRLSQAGYDGLMQPLPETLLKNLLFYIAYAHSDSPRAALVRQQFKLNEALPAVLLEDSGDGLSPVYEPETASVMVAVLDAEFARLGEALSELAQGAGNYGSLAAEVDERLKRITDSLIMLGRYPQQQQLRDAMARWVEYRNDQGDQAPLREMADKLVAAENSLHGWLELNRQLLEGAVTSNEMQVEVNRAQAVLLEEAQGGLEKIKDIIVDFIASRWQRDKLSGVTQLLTDLRGALQVLELQRAARILLACQRYIEEEVLSESSVPNWNMLDALAESLTSIEYYLDVVDQRDEPSEEMVLSLAEQGVAKLGYPVHSLDKVAAKTAAIPTLQAVVTEPAPSGAPGRNVDAFVSAEEKSADVEPEIPTLAAGIPEVEGRVAVEAVVDGLQPQPGLAADDFSAEPLFAAAELAAAPEFPNEALSVAATAPEPAAEEVVAEDIDDEILDVFIEEVAEVLALVDENYRSWADAPDEREAITEIRRAYHTLKGGSRMVGAELMGELSWAMENLLNRVLEKRVTVTPTLIALVDLGREAIPGLVESFRKRERPPRAEYVAQLIVAAESLSVGENTSLPSQDRAQPHPSDNVEQALVAEPEVKSVEAGFIVDPEQQELLNIFAEEAAEHLAAIGDFVQGRRQSAPVYDPPTSALQSALHTLKGSARMAGVESIGDLVAPLEHFIKELYSYQLPVDGNILDLLEDAATYSRLSLSTVADQGRVEDIPELPGFLERLAELRDRAMAGVLGGEENKPLQVDPELLNLLMTEGMQPLLDAELGIQQWQANPGDCSPLRALGGELTKLATAAERAAAPPMAELARYMGEAYEAIIAAGRGPDDELLATLLEAHHSLLAMVDAVAANQDLAPVADELKQALQAVAAAEPQAATVERLAPDSAAMAEVGAVPEAVSEFVESDQLAVDESLALELDLEADTAFPGDTGLFAESAAVEEEFQAAPLSRDDIDLEILEIFISEADELLEDIDRALQRWAQDWHDPSHSESLKRSLHTFKGGARMAGLQQLGQLSHDFESEIMSLELRRDQLNDDVFRGLLRRQDHLLAALAVARRLFDGDAAAAVQPLPEAPPVPRVENVENDIEPTWGGSVDTGIEPVDELLPEISELSAPQQQRQLSTPQDTIKVSAVLLESLVNLAGETSISRGRVEQQVSDFSYTLDEMQATIARLKDQVRRIGLETEAHMMFRQEQLEAMNTPEGFDPLEMDRYSMLQQLSQSLLESTYDLQDLKETLGEKAKGAEAHLLTQSRINSDLQERLMRMRLVPFTRIVPRLRRIVRQVSDELGKKVELQLVNLDGEMDRSVMEQMMAPLEHMVRNAIDHGMEPSEERLRVGKPETGTISVGLVREGGDILLQLSDDGRGLNIDAIRRRAIDRGLLPEDNNLDDQDVVQFIFEPGFSTSETVSQVSGRGVGMDVVNSQVRELGGSIQTLSQPGQGTRFVIRLPFTVSVNRALMIDMAGETYALPLSTVDGVVRISPKELEYYYRYPDAHLEYAGEQYEVRYLGSLLRDNEAPKIDTSRQSVFLVLVHSETRHFAVQVDGLSGSAEIVSKSLGSPFSKVPGLSGATLMGDGRVVVILDLLGLLRASVVARAGVEVRDSREEREQSRAPRVMVVDDSVTVRKVTTRFLEREGFEVVTARDGVEAMKLLQDERPDVMLLDIEMPRMDGFEVAKRVKGSFELRSIPIIMITSRTGDKHRERALALGVERYMGKPYQEDELLAAMSELMQLAEQPA